MVERNFGEIPARLRRLEQLFAAWRKTRVRGDRIPQSLWKSAAKLATDFGLSRTSTVLKLDYYLAEEARRPPVDSDRAAYVIPRIAVRCDGSC